MIQYDLNDAEVPSFMLTEGVVLAPNFIFGKKIYLTWLPTLLRGRRATEDILKLLGREMDPRSRYGALQGWPVLADSYRRTAAFCRQRNIPCWVVLPAMEVFPGAPEKTYDEKYDPIRKLCGEINLPVIDTFPITQKWAVARHRTPADLAVAPGDWHPTPERHGLMARAMLAEIAPAIVGNDSAEAARQRVARRQHMPAPDDGKGLPAGTPRPRRGNWTQQRASLHVEPHGRACGCRFHIVHPKPRPSGRSSWRHVRRPPRRRRYAPGRREGNVDCAGDGGD